MGLPCPWLPIVAEGTASADLRSPRLAEDVLDVRQL